MQISNTQIATQDKSATLGNVAQWSIDDIEFDQLDLDVVRQDEDLFFLLAMSSFVEIAADLYTRNLRDYFCDHQEVSEWLGSTWGHEEIQHGEVLKLYVNKVWPEFDWDLAYTGFLDEYAAACTNDELEPTRAREMAARCAVEMGTSSFYSALNGYAEDPVLQTITNNIKKDEVTHYRHFRKYYYEYNEEEKNRGLSILFMLFKRFNEAENDDALIAYRHVYKVWHNVEEVDPEEYDKLSRRARKKIFLPHFPYKMAVRMLLNLVEMRRWVRKIVEPTLIRGARFFFFR